MVRPKKAPSKKQARGSIDFKKIKRKIGRKLPPPKNSTNTEIKSKAIVLPEQSVASEREGLAVSKKGLTLRELLQQSSHHNAKTRKFALVGIRDLLLKHPLELRLHKLVIIEKLRERVCDNDKVVRDTLYQLLRTVVFATPKEDVTGPAISLMMAYVFNAMTHLVLDIRLMAFKFLDLIVTSYPDSFFQYAEKIIDNYRDVLQNNQIYLQDRSKIKSAISGLVGCLSLLASEKRDSDQQSEQEAVLRRLLHAFPSELPKEQKSTSSIFERLEAIMPILVNSFNEFLPAISEMAAVDAQSFDCMLSILQSIKLAVCFLTTQVNQSRSSVMSSRHYSLTNTSNALKKLWDYFPIRSVHQLTEKEDDRYYILNIRIADIYFQLTRGVDETEVLMQKFLDFLEMSLYAQTCSTRQSTKVLQDKYLISLLPHIPGLVSQVAGDWRLRILKAFTSTFQECKVESKLNLACLTAIEFFLLHDQDMLSITSFDSNILDYQIAWLRKLPSSLLNLQETNPSISKVILRLLLRIGQCCVPNSYLDHEYNNLQFSLREFYCTCLGEGKLSYGPFINLSRDCQELSICCLYYFSNLNSDLLQSLAYCCLNSDSEAFIALRIIDVLQSAYKVGHIQISDFLGFLVTVVAHFKVFHGEKNSNLVTFRAITKATLSCFSEMGDSIQIFKLLQKKLLDEMISKLPADNMHGMLKMIAVLDSRLSNLSDDMISMLGQILSDYLIDLASNILVNGDEIISPTSASTYTYYVKPCVFLFCGSEKLVNNVLRLLASRIVERDFSSNIMEVPKRVNAIVLTLISMITDSKVHLSAPNNKSVIKNILKTIFNLWSLNDINLTLEERHRIQQAFEHLKAEASKANLLEVQ